MVVVLILTRLTEYAQVDLNLIFSDAIALAITNCIKKYITLNYLDTSSCKQKARYLISNFCLEIMHILYYVMYFAWVQPMEDITNTAFAKS